VIPLEENCNYFCYARISSKEQPGNFSLSAQEIELPNHNVPKDHILIDVVAAIGDLNSSPVLYQLIARLQARGS